MMATKARELRLSLGNTFLSFKGDMEDRKQQTDGIRHSIGRWLDQLTIQVAIVVMVMIDFLLVTTLLLMDLNIIQASTAQLSDDGNMSTVLEADPSNSSQENALHIINIILLLLFFTEIVLRFVGHGLEIVKDHWQLFDSAVVVTTALMYIILSAASADRTAVYIMGYLIVLRLWRIYRIYKGICERERRKAERIMNVHRKARSDAEEQLKDLQAQLEKRQRELTLLRDHVGQPQYILRDTPIGTPNGQRRTMPDGNRSVASEEECDWQRAALETVQVELSPNDNYKYAANGSLPSLTPHGSVHSLHIGTPTSTGSFGDMGHSPNSDRASAKSYPDLVEHTPGMDIQTMPSSDSLKANEVVERDLGEGTNNYLSRGYPSRSVSKPELTVDYPEEGNRGPGRGRQAEKPSPSHARKSVSPQRFTNYRKKDRKKLLKGESGSDMSFVNDSFDGNLTREEAMEIKRISQVPFDSTTCLNDVEVPMTDL